MDFALKMSQKSDEDLQEYLSNPSKYVPEAIEAAFNELKNRGKVFDTEYENTVNRIIKQRRFELDEEQQTFEGKTQIGRWKKNVVTDINAPLLYSQRAINVFSILMNPVFGAVLLAINFKKEKKKNAIYGLIAFAIIFIVLEWWGFSQLERPTSLTYLANALGAFILTGFFWKKYLGKDLKYRARPVWVPIIIAIVISAFFILSAIYSEG